VRLALGLIVGLLVIFVTWVADPKEYAVAPTLNRLQNLLGYGVGIFAIAWGLGWNPPHPPASWLEMLR